MTEDMWAPYREAIRKVSIPIAKLTVEQVIQVISAMSASDGAMVDEGMPDENIALVMTPDRTRRMAVFGSRANMLAFAEKYRLKPEQSR